MLKVGVIGLGNMGKLHLMNALRIDGVYVVGAADKSERNRKFAERCRVKTYDDYSKLIDGEKLDAVIISLPNFLKKEGVFCAAERKLDIFLDKPLSRDTVEARDIVRKVERESIRLMVGVNYRYFPSVQRLKNNLDEGRFGEPVIATSELILNGPLSHGIVPTPVPEWWLNKELAGGGAVLDLGYHLIDIFSWMFGDLKLVHSSLGHRFNLPLEDSGSILLESETSHTMCVLNVGWFSKLIFPDFNFRINIHGTVGYDSTDRYTPRNLRVHAAREAASNLFRKILGRKLQYLSYTYYYSSFYRILELFFEALSHGTELPVSLEQQLDVVKTIDSVYSR